MAGHKQTFPCHIQHGIHEEHRHSYWSNGTNEDINCGACHHQANLPHGHRLPLQPVYQSNDCRGSARTDIPRTRHLPSNSHFSFVDSDSHDHVHRKKHLQDTIYRIPERQAHRSTSSLGCYVRNKTTRRYPSTTRRPIPQPTSSFPRFKLKHYHQTAG